MDVKLPQELVTILELFLRRGHTVASPGSAFMFTKPNGTPMSKATDMTYLWQTILRKNLGSDSTITPHM